MANAIDWFGDDTTAAQAERFAGLSPLGTSILARQRRPSPPFVGPFCVQ